MMTLTPGERRVLSALRECGILPRSGLSTLADVDAMVSAGLIAPGDYEPEDNPRVLQITPAGLEALEVPR